MLIDKPVVFLPIECTPRELDYKLNFARYFLAEGYNVMIGNPPYLRDEMKYKNFCGMFLEKGGNPDSEYYTSLKNKDILIYCLSDEGAAHPAFSVTYDPAVKALKCMEKIFLWGEFQRVDLTARNNDPDLTSKYHVTGYPGFEFSMSAYREYNKKLKPQSLPNEYILVNTNFSLYNGFNVAENLEACPSMSPETLGAIEENYRHEKMLFDKFYAWLIDIIKHFPQQQFLIRPHPGERKEKYDEYFSSYRNVVISKVGDINQVISSAKVVIHRDCTTALQSYLMGIPVVSLVHSNFDHIHSPWAINFGAQPKSVEDAKSLIAYALRNQSFTQDITEQIRKSAESSLSERFSNLGNSTKEILAIIMPRMRAQFEKIKPYKLVDNRTLLQKIKLFVRKFMPLHYKVPKASRGLLLPFSKEDIRRRMALMKNVDGLSVSCDISNPFPNVYFLQTK